MSIQKSFNFSLAANGTTVIVTAGNGLVINCLDFQFINTLATNQNASFNLTDNASVILLSGVLQTIGSGVIDRLTLSGLVIPTTSIGGLSIAVALSAPGSTLLKGNIIYTVP